MNIVVLLSGRGSNMQAIHQAIAHQGLPVRLQAVVSNRPQAAGLAYARRHNIDACVVDHRCFSSRCAHEQALVEATQSFAPDWVVLAGYMRILEGPLIRAWAGRLLNIHPSLLPLLPGLNTHQRALDAGHARHGASVHIVTEELDAGPLLTQASLAVNDGATAAELAHRVLALEHRLYPATLRALASGVLCYTEKDKQISWQGRPVSGPLMLETIETEL